MKITEDELIKLIPNYLKLRENDSNPLPAMICTMGVDFGEDAAQIKLTSLRDGSLSMTFYIADETKKEFIKMYRKINEAVT